ncbi:heavy-metal-associated domain-containing protein [Pseudoduganella rivuli]|nr:heavy-metal-associated domain-containing protein [Pseudoduganella rivuli]
MQNAILKIDGMTSEGCADLVATVLGGISGVGDVRVSLLNCLATVQYDERHTTPQLLAGSLARAGYPAQQAGTSGGCCGGCCG